MTDTINTLTDPGSDPAHEWQQPPFTPDEYRTAAKVCDAASYPTAALEFEREAARLEAESARDEEVEKLAKVQYEGEIAYAALEGKRFGPWEEASDFQRAVTLAGVQAVLDRLAADGRLLPEGGTVLDAGQVRDVNRILTDLGVTYLPERLRGVFSDAHDQAGAPAVSVPDSNVHNHSPREGRGLDCPEQLVDGRLRGVCMDSGPDGTPEKPWPTWQDVPEGVKVRGTGMDGSISKKGDEVTHWHPNGAYCCLNPLAFTRRAPFVRVDGDKA